MAKLTVHVKDNAADNWRCQIIVLRPARQLHVEIFALQLGQRQNIAHPSLRERVAHSGAIEHCIAVPPGNPWLRSTCSKAEEKRIIECNCVHACMCVCVRVATRIKEAGQAESMSRYLLGVCATDMFVIRLRIELAPKSLSLPLSVACSDLAAVFDCLFMCSQVQEVPPAN